MVSPQALLGIAVGTVLGLIGAYVLWLDARLRALETKRGQPPEQPAPRERKET